MGQDSGATASKLGHKTCINLIKGLEVRSLNRQEQNARMIYHLPDDKAGVTTPSI